MHVYEDFPTRVKSNNPHIVAIAIFSCIRSNPKAQASDIIFYRASEEETLNEILATMMTALYEPFFLPDESREFTITKCILDLPNQKIWTDEEMIDELTKRAWTAWNGEESYRSHKECIMYTLYDEFTANGLMPVSENMWLLPSIEGYYHYDGKDQYSFEEYMEMNGEAEQYGLLPFVQEGDGKDSVYLLVKEKDVYRLQRVADMGIALPMYYGESEEVPDEFCTLVAVEIDRYLKRLMQQKMDGLPITMARTYKRSWLEKKAAHLLLIISYFIVLPERRLWKKF